MIEIVKPNTSLPIVFIHGSFANANSWRKIMENMQKDHDCLAVNLPGHGGIADPKDFLNPTFEPEFKAIIKAIEANLDVRNGVHLVGHSYGGVVALAATMNKVLDVRKLTLFEPVAVTVLSTFDQEATLKEVDEFVEHYTAAHQQGEAMACRYVMDFWGGAGSFEAIPPHVQIAMAEMTNNNLRHWDLCKSIVKVLADYQNLDIPVQLINGEKSNSIAKTIVSSLDQNLPQSKAHIIKEASHFMITSHADRCIEILRNR